MTEEVTQEVEALNVGDLQVMVQVIAAGSQRGAFKPEEMAVVGATYNKLTNILQAQGVETPEQKAQAEKAPKEEEKGKK